MWIYIFVKRKNHSEFEQNKITVESSIESKKGIFGSLCSTEFACTKNVILNSTRLIQSFWKVGVCCCTIKIYKYVLSISAQLCHLSRMWCVHFYMDLCETFVAAEILPHASKKPSVRNLLGNPCKQPIPDELLLRKKCI